jgi:hypothetical protein
MIRTVLIQKIGFGASDESERLDTICGKSKHF